MKIILISDTHGNLPDLSGIEADILIHAGDICPNFSWDAYQDALQQTDWLCQSFLPWVEKIKTNQILICGSNHDLCLQYNLRETRETLSYDKRIKVLIDKDIMIGNKKAYFTPWIPYLEHWAYTAKPENMVLAREMIPNDTQILISHCPPFGILDEVNHYGCKNLLNRIASIKNIEQVWFGHCHEDGGKEIEVDKVKYINAAGVVKVIEI